MRLPKSYHPRAATLRSEPHVLSKKAIGGSGGIVELRITFMGSNEPSVELDHELCLTGAGGYTYYLLELEQGGKSWIISDGSEESHSPISADPSPAPAVQRRRDSPQKEVQPRSLEQLLLEQHGSIEAAVEVLYS